MSVAIFVLSSSCFPLKKGRLNIPLFHLFDLIINYSGNEALISSAVGISCVECLTESQILTGFAGNMM